MSTKSLHFFPGALRKNLIKVPHWTGVNIARSQVKTNERRS